MSQQPSFDSSFPRPPHPFSVINPPPSGSWAHLCDLPALVVPSQQCDVGWESSFEKHEHGENFQTVVPTVYKISHEDVVCQGDLATSLKQPEQVMELAVNVAAYL